MEIKKFYYQLKGKAGEPGWSNWTFPPIFSGKVLANDKKEAKKLIEEEYGKKFPLRVLSKDLDSNEFLLKITDMTNNSFLAALFEERECEKCQRKFRIIDLYNDANVRYKGAKYCSDNCKDKAYDEMRSGIGESTFGDFPVIYKITNRITDECYIGQTAQSFTLRWWQHIKWGKSDCKFHKAMRESKITDWIFEVIEVVSSKDKLDERELFYINQFNSIKEGYNTAKINQVDGKLSV